MNTQGLRRLTDLTNLLFELSVDQDLGANAISADFFLHQLMQAMGARDKAQIVAEIHRLVELEEYLKSIEGSFDVIQEHLSKIEKLRKKAQN